MRVYKVKNYDEMSRKAAAVIAAQVVAKPDCVLGLATGSTPLGTYAQLIKWYEAGELDFSEVTSVNLDEYRGLSHDHDQSYYYFMRENLFSHINIDMNNTNVPNGMEPDSAKACSDYDQIIEKVGGMDLQLLGLGRNGHIGFNEPSDGFVRNTNCVNLTESTIDANKRFFASIDDVPRQAYTMGIGAIMNARKVLLIVSGADKAEALRDALTGPITPQMPASILQLHRDLVVVADEAALSLTDI